MKTKIPCKLDFDVPLFNRHICVFIGTSQQFDKKYKSLKSAPTRVGQCWSFATGDQLIWFNSHHNRITITTITHEIFHAVCGILRDIGISLTNESEEIFSYLNDYILEYILGRMKNAGISFQVY